MKAVRFMLMSGRFEVAYTIGEYGSRVHAARLMDGTIDPLLMGLVEDGLLMIEDGMLASILAMQPGKQNPWKGWPGTPGPRMIEEG